MDKEPETFLPVNFKRDLKLTGFESSSRESMLEYKINLNKPSLMSESPGRKPSVEFLAS
jgi:hypothetical protein